MTPVYIYALTDAAGVPRYVGQSVDPWNRKTNHCSRHAAQSVVEWISGLRERGEEPTLVVLYKVQPDEDPDERERYFIRLLSTTAELLNWRPQRPIKRRSHQRSAAAAMLADILSSRGMSQKTMAAKVGTDQANMSRILSGHHKPSRKIAVSIMEAFGVPAAAWEQAQ